MLAPDCARQGGRSIGWRIVLTPNGKEQFAGLNNIVATAGDVRFGNRTVMLAGALGELEVEHRRSGHIVTNVVPIVTTDPANTGSTVRKRSRLSVQAFVNKEMN